MKHKYDVYGTNRVDRNALADWEKQLPRLVYDGDEDDGQSKEVSVATLQMTNEFGFVDH